MRKLVGFFAAIMMMSTSAFAANIYVRDTVGMNLSDQEIQNVTESVKRSVQNLPEHEVAQSEDAADFVLQPAVLQRGDQTVLRIERMKDGETLSIAEQPILSASSDASLSEAGSNQQYSAAAQQVLDDENMIGDRQVASEDPQSGTQAGMTQEGDGMVPQLAPGEGVGGEVRGPSPRFRDDRGFGYFTIGAGPALAIGLDSDNVMYNIHVGYNMDFLEQFTGRAFGDFNMGSAQDTARFFNFGGAVDWFPQYQPFAMGTPYVTGLLGYGTARHQNDETAGGLTAGAGAGFKFQAAELNWDVNLNYTILTSELEGAMPSVLGLRAAVNF